MENQALLQEKPRFHFWKAATGKPVLIFVWILFRVTYKEVDGMKGYFLVKRAWVWLLLPFWIMLIINMIRSMISTVLDMFQFDMHCTPIEKQKLSWAERVYLTNTFF
jgi:hypothetical protein